MKREEWIKKMQAAWDDISNMNMCFENINFYEESGETSDEARNYISMVEEEIEGFDDVLNEIHEKIEILQCVIDEEQYIDE